MSANARLRRLVSRKTQVACLARSPATRLGAGGEGAAVRTPLCELLGIDLPILNVGFGDGAPAELAAAVSNAGGCGVVGSAALSASAVRAQVARTRAVTDRPFGVNVSLAGLAYDGWSSAGVDLTNQMGPLGHLELVDGRLLGLLGDRCHDLDVELLADDSGRPQQVLHRGAEAGEPLADDLTNSSRPGCDHRAGVTVLDDVTEHLADEERVARSLAVHGRRQLGCDRLELDIAHPGDQLLDAAGVQPSQ